MGRPEWVARKLRALLDQHNTRLRNIARFSNLRNSVSVFDGVNVARSLTLQALVFSANARDVHFRSIWAISIQNTEPQKNLLISGNPGSMWRTRYHRKTSRR